VTNYVTALERASERAVFEREAYDTALERAAESAYSLLRRLRVLTKAAAILN